MHRAEKSERSRRTLLDSALRLFSRQGYRATTVRDIAEDAGVSTGNLYHHFTDKEAIFRTLLDEYREITMSSRFPIMRALTTGVFPENLEALGFATRESVKQFRSYMALHYVDVIEFEGTHIRTFYSDLAQRFADAIRDGEGTLAPNLARRFPPSRRSSLPPGFSSATSSWKSSSAFPHRSARTPARWSMRSLICSGTG